MRILFVTLALVCAACNAAPGTPQDQQPTSDMPDTQVPQPKQWKVLYTDGVSYYALIDQRHWKNKDLYWDAALDICKKQQPCMVAFWKDTREAPTAADPLNKKHAASQTALYGQNEAKGMRKMIWSCDLAESGSECFN